MADPYTYHDTMDVSDLHRDIDLQDQPVLDTAVAVVSLLRCLVHQAVCCRRVQCAFDEEHVTDVDSESLVSLPDNVVVVATVQQLPKVHLKASEHNISQSATQWVSGSSGGQSRWRGSCTRSRFGPCS